MSTPRTGSNPADVPVTSTTPATSPQSTSSGTTDGATAPSMSAASPDRHAELLQILNDIDALPPEELVKSDLPEQADRLLKEINANRKPSVPTIHSRRFRIFKKRESVNRILAKLKFAEKNANLPTPYPIDKDPLRLERFVRWLSPDDVAKIASEFPQLRSALSVYQDVTEMNHLARLFHRGASIDFELDLRSKKIWQLMPVHDAIHQGPAANFIVFMKSALFHFERTLIIPTLEDALEEFIDVRKEEDVRRLILHCKDFAWPDTISISPESKIAYVEATRENPVEDILFDLIAPIVATHKSKSDLISLMADVNPSRLSQALKRIGFTPTDGMIAGAQTPEGRKALRQLKTSE